MSEKNTDKDSTNSKEQNIHSKSPQPGTSQNDKVEEKAFLIVDEEPKAGPSTTAADFDLEVFDSGSSCSLEDCWNRKDPGEN